MKNTRTVVYVAILSLIAPRPPHVLPNSQYRLLLVRY